MLSDDDHQEQVIEDSSQASNPTVYPSPRSAGLFSRALSKSDQHQTKRVDGTTKGRAQPSPEDLARYGIKARDFFYESTLPPIPPIIYRQVQPGPSPQKRNHKDGELIHGDPDHRAKRIKVLGRVPTEVIGEDNSQPNSRGRGFVSRRPVDQWGGSSRIPMLPNPLAGSPPRSTRATSGAGFKFRDSTFAPPTPQLDSQNSEPDAPRVTPTGSFHRNVPSIQVTDPLSSQSDQASQHTDFSVLYSQFGLTPGTSQVDGSRPIHNPAFPSHLTRSHSSMLSSSSKLARRTSSLIRRTSSSHITPAPPRYFLRQRKVISYFTNTSSGRATRRGRDRGSSKLKKTMRPPSKL